MLKDCSENELRKLGYIALGDESRDEQNEQEGSQPDFKKQKLSKPDFDDLMADSWNACYDGKPQKGEEYDLWSSKFQKNNKFTLY